MKKINSVDKKILQTKYSDNYIKEMLNKNYPVQYLIGNVNFYGYEILVNEDVFIPRFETEGLIENTLNYLENKKHQNLDIIDICTGSGCISITIKNQLPNSKITAIDINKKSLSLAKKSALLNKAPINFKYRDIFKIKKLKYYDLIISNPPYVSKEEITDLETKYEPQIAIYENNEIEYYKHILKIADPNTPIIAFEIGMNQGNLIASEAKKYFPNHQITIKKDLTGRNRYIFIVKNA